MAPETALLLVAGLLFAWRFSQTKPEPDWSAYNLFAFLGAVPYRDHQLDKPPGIVLWYWVISRIVGKDIARVKFVHHALVNFGAIIALYAWGLPAGLAWLVLMNAIHFFCFMGNVESVAALFLTACLATSNPWLKVIAFSLACFFNLKVWPMGIILWPYAKETLAILAIWLAGFAIFYRLRPDIANPMIGALTIEANRIRKRRMGWGKWFSSQYLRNNCYWQSVGILILWGGLAIWNRPEPLFWLPCILYLGFCSLGKTFGLYHNLTFIPWIAIAVPNIFPLVLLISFAQLGWDGFYCQDLYFVAYEGLYRETVFAELVGRRMKGKKFWLNSWFHEIYIYAGVFPKYGIELQTSAPSFDEWKVIRNERLQADKPHYIVEGAGMDKYVRTDSPRFLDIGTFRIYQLRGKTDL